MQPHDIQCSIPGLMWEKYSHARSYFFCAILRVETYTGPHTTTYASVYQRSTGLWSGYIRDTNDTGNDTEVTMEGGQSLDEAIYLCEQHIRDYLSTQGC